jgi:hypothetical protein
MAAIDWDAAITALNSGGLPCSGGERRILLLSAGLAGGTPVSLRDNVTGLDDRNTALLITAIRHAAGKRPENSGHEELRTYYWARTLVLGWLDGSSRRPRLPPCRIGTRFVRRTVRHPYGATEPFL